MTDDAPPPDPVSQSARPSKPNRRRRRRKQSGPVVIRTDSSEQKSGEAITERLKEEVKSSGPGVLGSLGIHAFLFLIFWIMFSPDVARLSGGLGGMEIELDLSQLNEKVGDSQPQPERVPIGINPKAPPVPKKTADSKKKPGTRKGKPVGKGPRPQPVKPVNVKKLFAFRKPEFRERILKELDPQEKVKKAISDGLAWLKRHQTISGKWQLHTGYPNPGFLSQKTDTGATALALLVFLGEGHTQKNRGPYRQVVEKGLKWLLGTQKSDGDLHDSPELGRQPAFYAHSQATIVLCEALAMTGDETLREPAQRAIQFLIASQNPIKGGWKYQPSQATTKGDLSVTGWALMALHSARAAGIKVEPKALHLAARFLDSVQEKNGALYKYEPPPTSRQPTPTMTAEGLLCRQFLGWPKNNPPMREGIDYLLKPQHQPEWKNAGPAQPLAYNWYYTGHVLHNIGGKDWKTWYHKVSALIVSHQNKSPIRRNRKTGKKYDVKGSWNPQKSEKDYIGYGYGRVGGRLYFTAMNLLVLQIPYRHNPLYPQTEKVPVPKKAPAE